MNAASDELTKPLGTEQGVKRHWPRIPLLPILAGVLACGAGGIVLFLMMANNPLGGEPHVLSRIETRDAASRIPDAFAGVKTVPDDMPARPRATAGDIESASGVSIVRPDGTSPPGSIIIRVPDSVPAEPVTPRLAPAPDKRISERSRHGILPKIGADGTRASSLYARAPGTLPSGRAPAARVAILVGGLGISQSATGDAISKLPPDVTLAFAPYGADLERHVTRARAEGHEVMLQVPMEPFDYPDNDPGPHTLTVKAKGEENIDRLHWVMGRFAGYTGVVNFMGARLTANEAAVAPVLKEIAGRGLAILDDGTSSRSLVGKLSADLRMPAAKADVVLDGVVRAEQIDKELQRLEALGRERGFAVGTASALPLTVDRIARWAKEAAGRGVLLVPVSSAFQSDARG